MSWSALLSQTQIQKLKDNTSAYGLCAPWMQNVLGDTRAVPDLQIFSHSGEWLALSSVQHVLRHCVYRLNPEWEMHTEEEEPEYEYEEPFKAADGCWRVLIPSEGCGSAYLSTITCHSRFCGIEYKEDTPGTFRSNAGLMIDCNGEICSWDTEDGTRPATPVRVRFLKEKK